MARRNGNGRPALLRSDLLRFATAGLGRRRQVDADRPAALRLQGRSSPTSSTHVERASGATATARPRAADRRPARRARAGHHDRRRLPLLRDAAAARSSSPTRPGHVQYTRNMVTGASTADLAIVLVDARNGVVEQTKRHAFIASLLGIPHIVVAVNKMDLVDYDEAASSTGSSPSSATFAAAPRRRATSRSSRSPRCTATTSSTAPRRCPGTRARRCSTTSRRADRRRPQPRRRCASRCST